MLIRPSVMPASKCIEGYHRHQTKLNQLELIATRKKKLKKKEKNSNKFEKKKKNVSFDNGFKADYIRSLHLGPHFP